MFTLNSKGGRCKNHAKFRPINLIINCRIKIFSKSRLGKIAGRLISPHQSAFIQGRCILESVVIAHELVHSLHSSKELGIVLKLDYKMLMIESVVTWDWTSFLEAQRLEVLSQLGLIEQRTQSKKAMWELLSLWNDNMGAHMYHLANWEKSQCVNKIWRIRHSQFERS